MLKVLVLVAAAHVAHAWLCPSMRCAALPLASQEAPQVFRGFNQQRERAPAALTSFSMPQCTVSSVSYLQNRVTQGE